MVKSKVGVFLDRDGVINYADIKEGLPTSPRTLNDLIIIPGVHEAIALLQSINLETIVVTNQPDIARGNLTCEILQRMHDFISEETGLKHFYVCKHDSSDRCSCRKPQAGLLEDAAFKLNIDLSQSYLVGDRWKDIEAGQKVGCTCFFVDYGYLEKYPRQTFHRVSSLLEAAVIIRELEYCGN